jgi:hypothetical protein
MGSKEYEIGICCFSAKQAAVRSKSKVRVKYVTDNTYFVFVTDTDGTWWKEVVANDHCGSLVSEHFIMLVGCYFEDIIQNLEQRKVWR